MVVALAAMAAGCLHPRARIRGAGVEVVAPPDAASPATVEAVEVPLAAGSVVTWQRETAAVEGAPASVERVTVKPSAATVATVRKAATGIARPPDRRVELARQSDAARAPLLLAAIGAAALGVVAVMLRYPTPAVLCGLAAAGFFAGWKMAALPGWVLLVGVAAVAAAVAMYLGHELGERSKLWPPQSGKSLE